MRAIEITDTVTLSCSAEQAWAVVADYSFDVRWRSGVLSMTAEPSGPVVPGAVTVERMRLAGKVWENVGEVRGVESGRRFTWRTVAGADAEGARGVAPAGPDRCVVTLELRVRPRGAERLLAPVLGRMLRRNLGRDLERLGELIVGGREASGLDGIVAAGPPD